MKTSKDPRHLKRIRLMQELFSWDFQMKKPSGNIKQVIDNLEEIDRLIMASAPERPVSDINRIDLAILRLAVFELIMEKGTPPKVVIDEAIELGKEYGSEKSAGFINGALGKLVELKEIKT